MQALPGGGKGGRESEGAHSNVFVGNLTEGVTQAVLERVFSAHGVVQSCSVMTKSERTYGFVKFATVASAQRAIASLNGQAGWLVRPAKNDMAASSDGSRSTAGGSGGGTWKAVEHSNVFVGNLEPSTTEAALEQAFGACGKLKSCVVMAKDEQTYGFVEFLTIPEAQHAISTLHGHEGWVVKFANNDTGPSRVEEAVPHSNVFVGNLPADASDATLREAFAPHGSIQSCIVVQDGGEGAHGFVKFSTIAAAGRAIAAMNGESGWVVKCANNDAGGGGSKGSWPGQGLKGLGKGGLNGAGGKGGWAPLGWVWQPSNRPRQESDKPEAAANDNLYIKDLPPGVTEEEVVKAFSQFGQVVESRMLRWDSVSECAALIRMADVEQASQAKAQLHGTVLESIARPLSLSLQEKRGEIQPDHVYILGLHCTATNDQLAELFSRFGTVKWCRILPLPYPPTPQHIPDCAGLVQMATPEEANAAIAGLNGEAPTGLGLAMTVNFAEVKPSTERAEPKPNNNLYVKGWPVGFPDFLLQSEFQQFGHVVRLRLLDNPDPEQPTCAALVQMSRVEEAVVAMRALNGRTLSLRLPPMHVRYAGRDQSAGDNLYVTALPRTITEADMRKTFQKYGEPTRLRLLVQQGTPETHALVQLSSPAAAAAAIKGLDGTAPSFEGPRLSVTYAARRESGR